MARLSKEQRKERRKQRRIKKALRSYRFRTLKNFLIWLIGLISSGVIVVGVIALCLAVIPISTFTGGKNNEYVSEKVANNTLLNVFMNIQDYDMSDLPIVADSLEKMIKDAGVDEYVEIDTAKMKTLKFDENFSNELTSCIKVVATLESINGLEMLGDIGKLNVFTEWEKIEIIEGEESLMPEVDPDGNIAKDPEGKLKSNPKMYYYKVENGGAGGGTPYSEGIEGDNAVYERAFDDNGIRVLNLPLDAELYFPAVAKISILDAVQVLGESFGRVQIVNLLENFGAGELTDSMIGKVLSGKRIRDMASIDANGILLADVLNYDLSEGAENDESIKQIFDILIQAVESAEELSPSTLTVGHLTSGFNVNGIALETVLGGYSDSNSLLYKVLLESNKIIYDPNDPADIGAKAKALTVNDIKIDMDLVKVKTVMPTMNDDTLTLIREAVNEKNKGKDGWENIDSNDDLMIAHVGQIDPNYIKLNSVMPYDEDNAVLYKVLLDSANIPWTDSNIETQAQGLTVKDIKFDTNNVKISSVMTGMNENTLTLIREAINANPSTENQVADNGELTIGHISSLDPNYIKLTSVVNFDETSESNLKMWRLLLEGTGNTIRDESGEFLSAADLKLLADEMTVNKLNLDVDQVRLSTVMPDMNGTLKTVLTEAFPLKEFNEIKVSDLGSADFSLDNVHLHSVMPNVNSHLKSILADAFMNTYNGDDYKTDGVIDKEKVFKAITIGDLSTGFSVDGIRLETVVKNPPEDLVALMEEMMQDDYSNITVSALSSFELTNVSLKTVVKPNAQGTTGNQILDALIAKDVKIGGLGSSINTLSLYDIYGKDCFVTLEEVNNDTTQLVTTDYKFYFDESENAFVHITDQVVDEKNTYYIHKDDGIWLLLCFEAEGFNDVWVDADGDGVKDVGEVVYDADGRPEKFVISNFNVASLGESTTIKDVLTNARMQQFIDAGIFDAGSVKTDFLKLPLSLIINPPV